MIAIVVLTQILLVLYMAVSGCPRLEEETPGHIAAKRGWAWPGRMSLMLSSPLLLSCVSQQLSAKYSMVQYSTVQHLPRMAAYPRRLGLGWAIPLASWNSDDGNYFRAFPGLLYPASPFFARWGP